MATTHLLYLHGFRSSPQSTKARLVQQRMGQQYPGVTLWCPQLPPSPRQAMDEVMRGIASWPRAHMAVMGSSLGGYYATWMAEQTGCRAVLLNPAVFAARDLATQVGVHPSWHEPQETFEFKTIYVNELRTLAVPAITRPERYYALIAKGDEVLDWREMSGRYESAPMRLLDGGDHALTDFDQELPHILHFLGLTD